MSENNIKNFSRDELKGILTDQRESFLNKDQGIIRDALKEVKKAERSPQVVVISGLRRVGKSTLLAQIADFLGKDSYYYVNFEDERLTNFPASQAAHLFETLALIFGEKKTFLLDEIQNVPGWERFVRRFMDDGYKFYITGSNASLLSRELGTKLTGRYISIELFPFSFVEFLRLKKYPFDGMSCLTTMKSIELERLFFQYLEKGGIAEALKYPEIPVHTTLFNDVLYRDIATRYQIEETTALKELAYYLMSNISSLFSYNKLKELLKLGSVNTIKNFVEYMELSWLVFVVKNFAFSVKKQQIAPKKIYSSDTGMAQSVAFGFSKNSGRYFENAVFLELRRKEKEIFYYKTNEGKEVDFYLPGKQLLIQACWDIGEEAVLRRECEALRSAMQELSDTQAIIVTASASLRTNTPHYENIEIVPVCKWFCAA